MGPCLEEAQFTARSEVGGAGDQAQALGLELDVGALVRAQQVNDRDRLAREGVGEDFAYLGLDRPMMGSARARSAALVPSGRLRIKICSMTITSDPISIPRCHML